VILHGYVEYFPRLYELFCYYPVVGRWCRVPARVIVDEDDRRRSLGDRFPENLTRMHERRIEQAAGYRDVALEPVLRVEHRNMELLDRQIFQSLREDLIDIAWPANGRSLLPFLCRHSPSQLERGVDANRTSRSYSSDSGESGDGLRRQQAQRATACRKNFLPNTERRTTLGSAP